MSCVVAFLSTKPGLLTPGCHTVFLGGNSYTQELEPTGVSAPALGEHAFEVIAGEDQLIDGLGGVTDPQHGTHAVFLYTRYVLMGAISPPGAGLPAVNNYNTNVNMASVPLSYGVGHPVLYNLKRYLTGVGLDAASYGAVFIENFNRDLHPVGVNASGLPTHTFTLGTPQVTFGGIAPPSIDGVDVLFNYNWPVQVNGINALGVGQHRFSAFLQTVYPSALEPPPLGEHRFYELVFTPYMEEQARCGDHALSLRNRTVRMDGLLASFFGTFTVINEDFSLAPPGIPPRADPLGTPLFTAGARTIVLAPTPNPENVSVVVGRLEIRGILAVSAGLNGYGVGGLTFTMTRQSVEVRSVSPPGVPAGHQLSNFTQEILDVTIRSQSKVPYSQLSMGDDGVILHNPHVILVESADPQRRFLGPLWPKIKGLPVGTQTIKLTQRTSFLRMGAFYLWRQGTDTPLDPTQFTQYVDFQQGVDAPELGNDLWIVREGDFPHRGAAPGELGAHTLTYQNRTVAVVGIKPAFWPRLNEWLALNAPQFSPTGGAKTNDIFDWTDNYGYRHYTYWWPNNDFHTWQLGRPTFGPLVYALAPYKGRQTRYGRFMIRSDPGVITPRGIAPPLAGTQSYIRRHKISNARSPRVIYQDYRRSTFGSTLAVGVPTIRRV